MTAELSQADRQMVEFAVQLTVKPSSMRRADVEKLRQVGYSDPAIHEIAQVTGLFNYYNRLADGLGIEPEPEWRRSGE